jgi:geranylgeranylglycerol-phosphate geranylgeranyltransferase
VAVPFIYGMAIASKFELNVAFFASLAFLSNTGREVTKGIVDVKGDNKAHVKTMAVRFGERKAALAAAIFYLSAVILSPIPWILHLVSFWFIPPVLVTDVGLAAASFMLIREPSRENARRIKKTVLFLFIMGLLGFILGATIQ